MLLPFKNCPMNVLYKVSWILTLREVISIRILSVRIISAIMNLYWSHAIALQKQSNERSHKFGWILTRTEVIGIRILRVRLIWTQRSLNSVSKYNWGWQTTDETTFQYSRLWVKNAFKTRQSNVSSSRDSHNASRVAEKGSLAQFRYKVPCPTFPVCPIQRASQQWTPS